MPEPNFQTVVLTRGSHADPGRGVCVVELASMIAGEPLSDRPASVCRVIAAFLRAYNDSVDARRRQDLYPCASTAAGTRRTRAVERRRIEHCLAVLQELDQARRGRLLRRLLRSRTDPAELRPLVMRDTVPQLALDDLGFGLARALRRGGDAGHERALALVDELAALGAAGAPAEDRPRPGDVRARARARKDHGAPEADQERAVLRRT
jgi:hypothetical protein